MSRCEVAGQFIRADPVDNTTTWTYDALNRVVQETNELGHSRYFVYDAAGYLT
ncbi:MAG: hypothetical protein KJ000_02160 [Pirellulaceae bacterium]|nr:hypothetical protein [Pirellulaceae bacterium]